MKQKLFISFLSAILLTACGNKKTQEETMSTADDTTAAVYTHEMYLLAGTYTSRKGSRGIYLYRFDTRQGTVDSVGMVESDNPSYLALSPDERFVYAVNENGGKNAAANAFAFDKRRGRLELLNSTRTQSPGPCYIAVDRTGESVFTANYSGGTLTAFQVKADGSLSEANMVIHFEGSGPDSLRQEQPHLHSARFTPDGRFLFAADLGSDRIYRFDAIGSVFKGQPSISQGSFKEFATPSGTGPRHFDFHPGGLYFYLLGELSGQVMVFDYNAGDLVLKQTIAADTVGACASADIHVSPDGRFLYASNRSQADGIAIFAINPQDGTLSRAGYQPTGKHPRNFAIAPDGKWLLVASRDDNKIEVFAIDYETGLLAKSGRDIPINQPVCLLFAER